MIYTVNFFADVDIDINADSIEELKEKIASIDGTEIKNRIMQYVYLRGAIYVLDEDGNEVKA